MCPRCAHAPASAGAWAPVPDATKLPGLMPRPPLLPGPPLLSRSLVATLPRPLVATLVPAPVAVVVVAVHVAVEVVVAEPAVPVVTPAWVPKIAGAPVIQRYRADVGLGGTRRQPQTGQPQTPG